MKFDIVVLNQMSDDDAPCSLIVQLFEFMV